MTNQHIIGDVMKILKRYSDDPSDEIVKMGLGLIKIGERLKGKSHEECVSIIEASYALCKVNIAEANALLKKYDKQMEEIRKADKGASNE